jgi:hypothetical protein
MSFNTNHMTLLDTEAATTTTLVPGQVPAATIALNGVRFNTRSVRRRRLPPQNVEQVVQLNSRFWHATKGVLLPGIISASNNPPKYPQNEGLLCLGSVVRTDLANLNASAAGQLTPTAGLYTIDSTRSFRTGFATAGRTISYNNSTTYYPSNGNKMDKETETFSIPCAQSGAYFTGLSNETTFQLELKVFIEAFPFPGNSDYALASPSTPLDTVVLDVLPKLFWELDPGFPQDWNSLGKYFKQAWDLVKKVLPSVPSIIANRLVPGSGPVVQTVVDKVIQAFSGKGNQPKVQKSQLRQPTVYGLSKRGQLPKNHDMMNGGGRTSGIRPPQVKALRR